MSKSPSELLAALLVDNLKNSLEENTEKEKINEKIDFMEKDLENLCEKYGFENIVAIPVYNGWVGFVCAKSIKRHESIGLLEMAKHQMVRR